MVRNRPLTALPPLVVLIGATAAAGCLDRPLEPLEPRTTRTVVENLTQTAVDKIDLLLVIDNSGSMADKQEILAQAVPDLVSRLVNPLCVDDVGAPVASQPTSPVALCPEGSFREFEPVLDVHVGIISSSLGSYGGTQCTDAVDDDRAHLLARDAQGAKVPTYEDKGFLAWDPEGRLSPAGESDFEDGLVPALRSMVLGVGQVGCGYEAQLESWYRFLVDPAPYESLEVGANQETVRVGVDQQVLTERADFLRPDSLLAIVMLTDENDCSIRDTGKAWRVSGAPLSRGRQECENDPDHACCAPCDAAPASCPVDPSCEAEWVGLPGEVEDHPNLRCFDQVRRFGEDFLQPAARYVKALTETEIEDHEGKRVPNPILLERDKALVFFAGIVGVPWQDIARDPADLTRGFKNGKELGERVAGGPSGWQVILGDPATRTKPLDPLMHESVVPRSGVHPITGEAIGALPVTNAINGNEWTPFDGGDLQYACTFPIAPRSCVDAAGHNILGCDCGQNDSTQVELDPENPLCDPDPDNGGRRTLQARAKAYPGLRELSVLAGIGDQAIVASVCPKQLTEPAARDYGYAPAVGAIIERLKDTLAVQCLPRSLRPDAAGQVACVVIEARASADCRCDADEGRTPIAPGHQAAVTLAMQRPEAEEAGWSCFCEVPQLEGAALEACRDDAGHAPTVSGEPVSGWCYVDPAAHASEGTHKLVARCPVTEKRLIRFVGDGRVSSDGNHLIVCSDEAE